MNVIEYMNNLELKDINKAIEIFNRESDKENPSASLLFNALKSIVSYIYNNHVGSKIDEAALHTQVVAIYPYIRKNGFKLKLEKYNNNDMFGRYNHVVGYGEDNDEITNIDIGTYLPKTYDLPFDLSGVYIVTTHLKRKQKIANITQETEFTCYKYKDGHDSNLIGTIGHKWGSFGRLDYDFSCKFAHNRVYNACWKRNVNVHDSTNNLNCACLMKTVGEDKWASILKEETGGKDVNEKDMNLTNTIVAEIPELTVSSSYDFKKPTYFVSEEVIQKSFIASMKESRPLDQFAIPTDSLKKKEVLEALKNQPVGVKPILEPRSVDTRVNDRDIDLELEKVVQRLESQRERVLSMNVGQHIPESVPTDDDDINLVVAKLLKLKELSKNSSVSDLTRTRMERLARETKSISKY